MDSPRADDKPVVYILHGDDRHALARAIKEMEQRLGDPAMAELNITRLDARQGDDSELYNAANALPFLTDRRLVIVDHPLARMTSAAARKRFLGLLDALPNTTALALVIEDEIERGRWRSLPEDHWLLKWANTAGKRVLLRHFALPSPREMPAWIRKNAEQQGGKFSAEAADELAACTGADTQLASQEVLKLLTYVDFSRPVEREEVLELCNASGPVDVFEMVDAIASGQTRQALALLHGLLEHQEPLSLFGMIVRQYRLMIQALEMHAGGLTAAQMAGEFHLPGRIAERLLQQARRFNMAELEAIYHRLLEMDAAMKDSSMPATLVLEMFIAEV